VNKEKQTKQKLRVNTCAKFMKGKIKIYG